MEYSQILPRSTLLVEHDVMTTLFVLGGRNKVQAIKNLGSKTGMEARRQNSRSIDF
jgi:hypothetical protein